MHYYAFSGRIAITQWCAAIAQGLRMDCASQLARSAALRSACAAITQCVHSQCAGNAQPLRSECAFIAQWVRSITHFDYAVLRSVTQCMRSHYAAIPLCVMAEITQITQSLRRRQLADVLLKKVVASRHHFFQVILFGFSSAVLQVIFDPSPDKYD